MYYEPGYCVDTNCEEKEELFLEDVADNSGYSFSIDNEPPPGQFLRIMDGNEELMVLLDLSKGTIEFGKSYTPDRASEIFWSALGYNCPVRELKVVTTESEAYERAMLGIK